MNKIIPQPARLTEQSPPMRYLPISLDIDRKRVLIVGSGDAAQQKMRLISKTTARIRLLSDVPIESLSRPLLALARQRRVRITVAPPMGSPLLKPERLRRWLDAFTLVYLAGDNADLNHTLYRAANRCRALVNWVDTPAQCDFITPAIVDRSPVTVAISTAGHAPLLGRKIKAENELLLPVQLGQLALRAGRLRPEVKRSHPDRQRRRAFWNRYFAAAFKSPADPLGTDSSPQAARLTLVSVDPNDPELLTIKALRRIQAAEVIVLAADTATGFDRYLRTDAERIVMPPQLSLQQRLSRVVEQTCRGADVVWLSTEHPDCLPQYAQHIAQLCDRPPHLSVIPGMAYPARAHANRADHAAPAAQALGAQPAPPNATHTR